MTENKIIDNSNSDWLTIQEAVEVANRLANIKLRDSDVYRHALHGNIMLSIYFQSPVTLGKIRITNHKVSVRPVGKSVINRLCLLEKNCFISGRDLILSIHGDYFNPTHQIIDTTLAGYEYIHIQRLLARSLNIPLPIKGAFNINYGITVTCSGEIYQLFERSTWQERINQQTMRLPEYNFPDVDEYMAFWMSDKYQQKEYFPIHDLPRDAWFVIRTTELKKLITVSIRNKMVGFSSTRISTPLSRLFWLACKHNETINPLIKQPYKLLSIFEQWASDDGITDRLSGDTLKNALDRGSPSSASLSS